MKVNIKTLQQTTHAIEISAVKEKIREVVVGNPDVDRQKLIHSGKVLVSEATVEACGIKEGDYMVVMVAPPKKMPTAASSGVAAAASSDAAAATSSGAASTNLVDSASTLLTGADYEAAVANIVAMGFAKSDVEAAMRASFNNPDRAVEFLMQGLPEGTDEDNDEEEEDAENPLGFLRSDPQFIQLRTAIQQNPTLLPPLLEQIGQANPALLGLIEANKEAFIEIMNEGGAGEEGDDPAAATARIEVSEAERDAIERLEQLGFDRSKVIEAFFACDKNEELAANFLFEHQNED